MRPAPLSTYRLQLTPTFTLRDALAIIDYLDALGVSALYLSPILRAEPGSRHGYDVVDATQVSEELGGLETFIALCNAAHARDMQIIIDFVPNHMGIASGANAWWQDVLENGASSRYADFFDIEWRPGKRALDGRVLLPILGDSYGEVLARRELVLGRDRGTIFLGYFARRLPLAPCALAPVLERAAAEAGLADDDPASLELLSIATALRNLPDMGHTEADKRAERAREKEIAKRRLAALTADARAVGESVDRELTRLNDSPDLLDELLSKQAYRLSHWRAAHEAINYRRFFDINTLAALRMEDPAVFAEMHRTLFDLCGQGLIDGLRLDHTDGLYDPTEYFSALRAATDEVCGGVWLVAEKILEAGEQLPPTWPIDGTTGYDYAHMATGVLCDTRAEASLDAFARRFTHLEASFEERVVHAKRLVLEQSLASELSMLARMLERIAEADRRFRDITFGALLNAISETIAHFPVYRSYLRKDGSRQPQDNTHIATAIFLAGRANPAMSPLPFAFLHDVLALRESDPTSGNERGDARAEFVMRFQQLTGPAMAKAVEDTAFYVYNRFIAANEVGGDPSHIGVSLELYHSDNAARAGAWPRAMVTTATHDTKRGEDARARLAVLSEIPDEWRKAVSRWARMAGPRKTLVEGSPAPSRNDEYLFYQALIGAMPVSFDGSIPAIVELQERLCAYMLKAVREAKQVTSWINPHVAYEQALDDFVRKLLSMRRFIADVHAFVQRLAPAAAANSLTQCVAKLCAPGVPDIYQGSELWDMSLVDPDNRRPIDYAVRRRLLDLMQAPESHLRLIERLRTEDGGLKHYVVHRCLQLRRELPALFRTGAYLPLDGGKHVLAYARSAGKARVLCFGLRLSLQLRARDEAVVDTRHVSGRYLDIFTHEVHEVGESLSAAKIFAHLPVSVLSSLGHEDEIM